MSITTLRIYPVEIGPEEAEDWLRRAFDKQRSIAVGTVERYSSAMQAGEWIPGGAIRMAVLNGSMPAREILVNGCHRLHAVVKSGTRQQFAVVEMHCDSEADVAMVYAIEDTGKMRTAADALHASGYAKTLGLPPRWEKMVASALAFIHDEFGLRRKTLTRAELIDLAHAYSDAVIRYALLISGGVFDIEKKLYRTGAMSLGLMICRYAVDGTNDDAVDRFWQGIARNDGLAVDDPRNLAVRHLLQTTYMSGRSVARHALPIGPAYEARYIANCWNAFVENRPLARTAVKNVYTPIRIKHTPYYR